MVSRGSGYPWLFSMDPPACTEQLNFHMETPTGMLKVTYSDERVVSREWVPLLKEKRIFSRGLSRRQFTLMPHEWHGHKLWHTFSADVAMIEQGELTNHTCIVRNGSVEVQLGRDNLACAFAVDTRWELLETPTRECVHYPRIVVTDKEATALGAPFLALFARMDATLERLKETGFLTPVPDPDPFLHSMALWQLDRQKGIRKEYTIPQPLIHYVFPNEDQQDQDGGNTTAAGPIITSINEKTLPPLVESE
jgi:hypothetical protein